MERHLRLDMSDQSTSLLAWAAVGVVGGLSPG